MTGDDGDCSGGVRRRRVYVNYESPNRTRPHIESNRYRVWWSVSTDVDENQPTFSSTLSVHIGRELICPGKLPSEDFQFDEMKHATERYPDVHEADS